MLLPFLVLSSNNAFASGAPSCLVPFKVVMFSSSLLAGVIVLVSNVSVADKNKKLAKKKRKKKKHLWFLQPAITAYSWTFFFPVVIATFLLLLLFHFGN